MEEMGTRGHRGEMGTRSMWRNGGEMGLEACGGTEERWRMIFLFEPCRFFLGHPECIDK